jgi:drug/metabolite transporter (DMT)-like permease
MAVYLALVFTAISGMIGLAVGDGRYSGGGSANLDFLLRAWVWPPVGDFLLLGLMGVIGSVGVYLVSQAYRLAQAGLIAPFEYVAMPLAIFWSIVIWGDWPDAIAWLGILLIAGSGFFVFLREAMLGKRIRWKLPLQRGR